MFFKHKKKSWHYKLAQSSLMQGEVLILVLVFEQSLSYFSNCSRSAHCLCWFPILISLLVLRWLFFLAKSLSFYGLYCWCTVVQKSPFDSNYSSHKLFYQLTLLPNEFVFFSKRELKCRGSFRKQFQVKIWCSWYDEPKLSDKHRLH